MICNNKSPLPEKEPFGPDWVGSKGGEVCVNSNGLVPLSCSLLLTNCRQSSISSCVALSYQNIELSVQKDGENRKWERYQAKS
jgi:hypothetical protein